MVSCGACGAQTEREPLCEECNDEDTALVENLRTQLSELREAAEAHRKLCTSPRDLRLEAVLAKVKP